VNPTTECIIMFIVIVMTKPRHATGWNLLGWQQISTGFASWLCYCSDVAQRRSTKLCTMFGHLLGWYIIYSAGRLSRWASAHILVFFVELFQTCVTSWVTPRLNPHYHYLVMSSLDISLPNSCYTCSCTTSDPISAIHMSNPSHPF